MSYQSDIRRLRQQSIMDYAYGDDDQNPDIQDHGPADVLMLGMNGPNSEEPIYDDNYMEEGTNRITPINPRLPPTSTPRSSPSEQMNQYYTPETRASLRLNALLDAPPERRPPSWARAAVASTMNLGLNRGPNGLKMQDAYMNAPYDRDVEDWKLKATPYQAAAQLENSQNINERTLAGNMINADTQNRRIEETERNNRERNDIARDVNEVRRYIANNQGYKAITTGPTVVLYNESTGDTKDTGVKTGHLSQLEKINLENEGRMNVARQQGANSLGVAQQQGANQVNAAKFGGRDLIEIDGQTYEKDAKTGAYVPANGLPAGDATRPSGPTSTGSSTGGGALERGRVEQERMRDLFQTDTTAQKYITQDQSGKFTLRNRPVVSEGNFFGRGAVTQQDVDAWDALKKRIEPNYTPLLPNTPTSINLNPNQYGGTPPPTPPRTGPPAPPRAPVDSYNYGAGPRPPSEELVSQTDRNNPMNKRRSSDGGRTWEISTDGGRTWQRQ